MSVLVREEAKSTGQGGSHCCWPLLSPDPNRKRLCGSLERPESEGAEGRQKMETGLQARYLRPPCWACACSGAYRMQATHITSAAGTTDPRGHCPCTESFPSLLGVLESQRGRGIRAREVTSAEEL